MIDPAETRRRLADARGVVRANLTLDSAVCRHAVRLGVATAVGVGIYRLFDIEHGYWIPLTVLFVLRPDFGSTFSRGGLRAAGTILGILLAGATTWAIGEDDTLALIPIAVFCWGALAFLFANYAVFTTSITALVVLMVDLAGEPAVDAMGERLVASAIGIVIALVVFVVWPTWTRERMAAAVGQYVDALRAYAVGVLQACVDPASHAADGRPAAHGPAAGPRQRRRRAGLHAARAPAPPWARRSPRPCSAPATTCTRRPSCGRPCPRRGRAPSAAELAPVCRTSTATSPRSSGGGATTGRGAVTVPPHRCPSARSRR